MLLSISKDFCYIIIFNKVSLYYILHFIFVANNTHLKGLLNDDWKY